MTASPTTPKPRFEQPFTNPSEDHPYELDTDEQYDDEMASATVLSHAQVKGAVTWAVVGALVVGALGFLVGWMFPIDGYSALTTAELVALCGALAGGVSGAVYGGGRQPEVDHEALPPDANVPSGVEVPSDVKVPSGDVNIIAIKASTDPEAIHVDRSDLRDVPTIDPAIDPTDDAGRPLRRPYHEPAFNDSASPLPHRPPQRSVPSGPATR